MREGSIMDYEKLGFQISLIGSAVLSVSAIIVAILAKSQAVLLDGLYTFVTLIMAIISIKIVGLIKEPETKKRPFGFSALEPFLNTTKCLIILVLLAAALFTNIQTLMSGGRSIDINLAAIYTGVCLIVYIAILVFIKRCIKRCPSEILKLEVKNWFIDTIITFGIAVALVIVLFLKYTKYQYMMPYVDPALTVIIVLVSLPIPLMTIKRELKNLLLISPENLIEKKLKNILKVIIEENRLENIHIYALKSGRKFQIQMYTKIKLKPVTIELLDEIREQVRSTLSKNIKEFYIDVIFTNSP